MNRKFLRLLLAAILLITASIAEAQQPAKIPRIGYVSGASNVQREEIAFRQGLRDLGYVERKNILIEYRSQEGKADTAPLLVAELIKLKVDVLVLVPTRAIRAAKQATQTIPIVMATTADPVATGLISSLARPGGNITGVTRITRDLNGKRLEVVKEVISPRTRTGVLFQEDSTSGLIHFKEYESAAQGLKMELLSLGIRVRSLISKRRFKQQPRVASARLSRLRTALSTLTERRLSTLP